MAYDQVSKFTYIQTDFGHNHPLLFVIREIHDGDIEEEIREAFRVFDKEGHGFIPVPDLTEVLTLLPELHRRIGMFLWLP